MVYVDTPFLVERDHPTAPKCFRGALSAHLIADTHEELVKYAFKIGLAAEWIQYSGTWREHFDVWR